MVHVETVVKRWGNSLAIIIPKSVTKRLGVKEGKKLAVEIKAKKRIDAFGILKGARGFREEKDKHKKFW